MGGTNSGRWGGGPVVEDGLTLDLSKLIRDGLFRPGENRHGTLEWTRKSTHGPAERIASLAYEAHLAAGDRGRVRLQYTVTRGDKREQVDDWVAMTATAQPFGGLRWWFVCLSVPLTAAKSQSCISLRGAGRSPHAARTNLLTGHSVSRHGIEPSPACLSCGLTLGPTGAWEITFQSPRAYMAAGTSASWRKSPPPRPSATRT